MTINTGNIAKLLMPGLNDIWGTDYTEHPAEWRDLVDVETSEKNYEEDQLVPGFGLAPIKPEGQAVTYDTTSQGVTSRYTHVVYALGFVVTEEAIDDNQYEKKAVGGTKQLAFSLRQTKENVVANLYNRAFNSSYTGADGKVLLATDHPIVAGTFSNRLATAADMSEAAIEDLVVQIGNSTDARGKKVAIMPKSLIVGTAGMFEATRILKSVGQNDTANNATNAMRAMGLFPEGAKVNHYLTDADAWFIRTNRQNGLKLFQRKEAAFTTDNDFDTTNLKFKATERYSTGWTDPLGLFGSSGA